MTEPPRIPPDARTAGGPTAQPPPSLADAAARRAAIDPAISCIVQAPAGSGKTGLLIQRILRLLAAVDVPEEVLAITFTRKAAGEMRERVLQALAAAGGPAPEDAHARQIWQLAAAVRERDRVRGWDLQRHPGRLRIQTIDAFNAALTRQLPLLSGLGAPPQITDRAQNLYATAAQRTLQALETPGDWADAVARFLLHLDNRADLAEQMLASMLARRDQWLPTLFDPRAGDRTALEAAIARELRLHLLQARAAIPGAWHGTLADLAQAAAEWLTAAGVDSPLCACAGLRGLPPTTADALPVWQGLVEMLLTRDGGWRKKLTKTHGFPPDDRERKARAEELLAAFAAQPHLAAQLHRLRLLPPARYTDEAWELLQALLVVLPLAVAELTHEFTQRGEVDHTEIALRALQALGHDEQPTDLALVLESRIRHILVDEFQDTSTTQYRLLEALTRGWLPGDGHSLFLVGDPMQSIYRFREAKVGLFLRARSDGLGALPLTPLRLTMNFRSRQPVVAWVNAAFPDLLAPAEDPASGAVPFLPAQAHDKSEEGGVGVHAQLGDIPDPLAEGDAVAALAARRLAEAAAGVVAILVRGRAQAAAILPALRRAGLSWQAVEIDALASRPVVQELLALTRALRHDGDRTAWLAVLRAPWCGLELDDLLRIAGPDLRVPLPARCADPAVLAELSADGRPRLDRVWPVLVAARAGFRRGALRRLVETAWEALGGPAAVGGPADLDDADAFFDLLESQERAGDLDDGNDLDAALAGLYAHPAPDGNPRLQVMTIHKAKGLEFDTVILPGLHARPRMDEPQPLSWTERPRLGAGPDLLLAPIRARGQAEQEPLHRFVGELAREQDAHERGRLLYVAVTRAIRRLELFGFARLRATEDEEAQVLPPPAGSLLAQLWPAVQQEFFDTAERAQAAAAAPPEHSGATLRRLASDWQAPEPAATVRWQDEGAAPDADEAPVSYRWVGATARLIGVVVHRYLRQFAEDGLAAWNDARIRRCAPAIDAWLSSLGVDPAELVAAGRQVAQALLATLADPRGRWTLEAHRDAASELALTAWEPGGPRISVIDRYFVDADGCRWIVDYKTGTHRGTDREAFLQQEVDRYRAQLQGYAAVLQRRSEGPIRAGLYFPLLQAFREVDLT